jgi:ComF family protein
VRNHAAPHIEWRGADGPLDLLGAIGEYDGRLRDIIHALKYEHRRSISRPLGSLMRDCGVDLLRDADVAVPVPLHPSRERSRGFNQADDLARQLGLPVERLLRRVIATTSQIELPAEQRHLNVRDAFAVVPMPRVPAVIVLVDDVSTTGSTLLACARVLKTAGIDEVRALTAARVSTVRR